MKKVSVLLVAVLTLLLVSCGGAEGDGTADGGGSSSGNSSLVVSWWGNQVRNERTQGVLDLFTEENPGVTFDGQFTDFDSYWQRLATAAAGNSLPDVIQMDYRYLDQYANNNLLLDLNPYVEAGTLNLDDASDTVIGSGEVNGELLAIPNGINAPALIYNKTVTDEAGVTINDNMTLSEFVEVSKTIYENTGYKTNFQYDTVDQVMQALLRAHGQVFLEPGKLGVDDPSDFLPLFELYDEGIREGWHIGPEVLAERAPGSVEQSPMVFGSSPETMSWCAVAFSNQYVAFVSAAPEDMELGITTWPTDNPQMSNYLRPSQFFSVAATSSHPEEAVKLIDFITNSVPANKILLGERGVPLSMTVADAIAPELTETEQIIVDFINDVITPNSSPIDPPEPPGSAEVLVLVHSLAEQVGRGVLTPEQAADQLFTEGNRIMANAGASTN